MANVVLDPRFKSDHIFNDVNRHFITLKNHEMQEYNVHLRRVLDTFILRMKAVNPLFSACYQRISFVGSYYEGLKVGHPEEFDLNIIINLPINYKTLKIIIASERPGCVKIKAEPDVLTTLRKHIRWVEYRSMDSWFDNDSYLDQNKFRQWFESVVTKALTCFPYVSGKYILNKDGINYLLHHKKSGPAWTLKIDVPGGHTVDVDIVPALEFKTPPPKPFIDHKTVKQNWFVISKPFDGPKNNILWQPSFYEREQEILKGSIKPVIRQMKKMRDTQNFKSIASYYIKTLFLWELENQKPEFQKFPSTFLFYYMLQKLRDACLKHEILDFWNTKNNLLRKIKPMEMTNISSRLCIIIKDIDRRIATDLYVIAEYILTRDELSQLKLSRLPEAMASASLATNNEQAQAARNDGYIATICNTFWNTKAAL